MKKQGLVNTEGWAEEEVLDDCFVHRSAFRIVVYPAAATFSITSSEISKFA